MSQIQSQSPAPTAIPPEAMAFREGMSRLGAAVNLVTTDGAAGRHGLTVSAVCSITDSPPTLMVCINRGAFSHDFFIENGVLAVNVLNDSHRELSKRFARWTGEDRFAAHRWVIGKSGAPSLADASASFDCRIIERQIRGSHSVLFCEVIGTRLAEGTPEGLIWFGRSFHPLSA